MRIAVLLPEMLGTYSDTGNATILAQRLRWRGIPAELLHCTAADPPPTSCDIYLLGGGENTAQVFAARWLSDHPGLCHALAERAMTLAVCAGLQILGGTLTDTQDRTYPGAELLDITTTPRRQRAIGEILTRCHLPGVGPLSGFENHHGATQLGPTVQPLGQVITGVGNGDRGRRRGEGVHTDHIIGTYLHGPVLARNPALADHILAHVTGHPLGPLEVPDQAALRHNHL